MSKLNSRWVVQPHGPLQHLDDGLWTVEGEIAMPLGRFPRRMTIVALSDGRLAVWSPVPLNAATMAELDAKGRVAFLIVPGIAHRLDLRAWASRYPKAKILSPPGARDAVSEAVPVAAVHDILDDPATSFAPVAGTGGKEAALSVRRDGGLTLVVNDMLANVRHPQGLGAKIMARVLGFGVSRPRMPRVAKRLLLQDKRAHAAQLRGWAADPALARIVVSHGDVIEGDCAAVLERAASDLD